MQHGFRTICLFVVLVITSSCRERTHSFPPLAGVTRLIVRNLANDTLRVIDNPDSIAAIVAYVNQRQSGWGAPWTGIPIGQVKVAFYGSSEFLGHVSAGPDFLETHQQGTFASQSATREELDEFARLIGVPVGKFTPE
jgi:hypothetical protein